MYVPPRRHLTPAQQALALDHLDLAALVAARFGRRHPPLADEFESAAYLALCWAAATFDPAGGACFTDHARTRLVGAMLDTHRHWSALGFRRDVGAAPSIGTLAKVVDWDERGLPVTVGDVVAFGDDPIGWGLEYQDELDALTRRLPLRVGWVLWLMHGRAGLDTGRAVARATGVDQRLVGRLYARAVGMANGKASA